MRSGRLSAAALRRTCILTLFCAELLLWKSMPSSQSTRARPPAQSTPSSAGAPAQRQSESLSRWRCPGCAARFLSLVSLNQHRGHPANTDTECFLETDAGPVLSSWRAGARGPVAVLTGAAVGPQGNSSGSESPDPGDDLRSPPPDVMDDDRNIPQARSSPPPAPAHPSAPASLDRPPRPALLCLLCVLATFRYFM